MVTPRTEPAELHAHAMDNLKYIRQTMERAGSFTAVPGKGGVLMGVVALLAAGLANRQAAAGAWLAIWTAAATIAVAIGIFGAALKSPIPLSCIRCRPRWRNPAGACGCSRRSGEGYQSAGSDPHLKR